MKKMGNDFEKRQKRNVVTFRYNMFIWAAELASVSWSLSPADVRLLVSMGLCKVSHCPEKALKDSSRVLFWALCNFANVR